jgi:hypothetical protein
MASRKLQGNGTGQILESDCDGYFGDRGEEMEQEEEEEGKMQDMQ